MGEITWNSRQTKRKRTFTSIPRNPTIKSVFLPAFSTSTIEIKVIITFIVPTPMVAHCAALTVRPASLNISSEKKNTALIPENCWASMMTHEMTSGMRRVSLVSISFNVTCGTSFIASYSARISSSSS